MLSTTVLKMITTKDIEMILETSEFKKELEDLSAYASSIRQERPIVMLLAKYFWQRRYKFAMEQKFHLRRDKCDLVVDGTYIEFKFHFDFDMLSLQKELNLFQGNIEMVWKAACEDELSKTWTVSPSIYKDVIVKRPDIFVWIICSRDLSKLSNDDIDRVCIGVDQWKYNRKRPYESNREFMEVAGSLLSKLQELRKFSLKQTAIMTNSNFPSKYQMMLCDFTAVDIAKTD
jgi:hypothetical protein